MKETTDSEQPISQKEMRVIWDRPAALERILNNEDLLGILLDVFIDEEPERVKEVKQSIESQDMESASRALHSIKGVAANLSGLRLQQLAGDMEQLARQGDAHILIERLPELLNAYAELLSCFKRAQVIE